MNIFVYDLLVWIGLLCHGKRHELSLACYLLTGKLGREKDQGKICFVGFEHILTKYLVESDLPRCLLLTWLYNLHFQTKIAMG